MTAAAGDQAYGPLFSRNETFLFSHYPQRALPAVLNVHFLVGNNEVGACRHQTSTK